ncbi:MAG: sigma-70 family RNA polymerase sigma factor [Armatimonadetes bacterium]|nr:sigma-70 family RNA polymerase sigma factor [Anaerolineae bacterium]
MAGLPPKPVNLAFIEPDSADADVIHAAQRGDLEAFNALVTRYQDRVYTLAYRLIGDPAAAADAAQEAFIHAYRFLSSYHGGSFKAWLLRIATNTCYDAMRYQKRRPATGLDDLPGAESDDGAPLPSDTPTPEEAVQQAELNNAIQACIDSLQVDYRLTLVMADVEDFSYQAIADSTGVQLGTVKSRLSRARLAMRRCLQSVQELLPSAYRLNNQDEYRSE